MGLNTRMIERYILAAVGKATLLTLVVFVVLMVFLRLFEEVGEIGRGQFDTGDAFLVALLSAPRHIFEVFPVAALIGSLLGLGGLASNGELVAMRAAGLSLKDILLTVLRGGLVFMVFVFAFGELVTPPAEAFANAYRLERTEGKVTSRGEYGFWARDGHAYVNIRGWRPGGLLQDIYIHEFDADGRLTLSSHARSARFEGDHWLLRDIGQSLLGPDRVETRHLAQARWDSLMDPTLLSVVEEQPSVLPVWELYGYMRFFDRHGLDMPQYEVAFWVKVFSPLAILIMLVLAVPFVLGSQRSWGMGQRVIAGAVIGTLFYSLNRGMSYSAVVYDIEPFVAAVIPSVVFATLGVLLLRRVR